MGVEPGDPEAPVSGPVEREIGVPEALAIAVQVHQGGHLSAAGELYRTILEAAPEHPDALHYLGVVSHQQGRSEAAVELIQRAITQVPDLPDMHINLGNVLRETGRLEDAEASYRKVLAFDPGHVDGLNNLGIVLKELGRLDEAAAAYARALEIAPDSARTRHNLANVLYKQGREQEAIANYRKAIEDLPFHRETYRKLARIYYSARRYDEAEAVYRQWLRHEPDNAVALHMLATCAGGPVPERASDGFVEQTFDAFAATFDKVLKRLDYKAPELIAAIVAREIGPPDKRLDVLDAGCGTGLCGPLLAPYARRLTGLDLSPAMLAKAEGREVYDELVTAEITAFLGSCVGAYDLIAAADTLCYFGALEPVLAAAAGALRPGGCVAFTVEKAGPRQEASGFHLHPHGRYSHSEAYVRRALGAAGLEPVPIAEKVLRTEIDEDVAGLVVLARKPDRPHGPKGLEPVSPS